MNRLRPSDLAHRHQVSTQAIRNYERDGFIPLAERTAAGYRIYTDEHAAALAAYLALVPAHGYARSGRIMRAIVGGDLDAAMRVVDEGHAQLLRDRETLDAVKVAIGDLTSESPDHSAGTPPPRHDAPPRTIRVVAHRLGVTPATLRNWERAGILVPERDSGSGHRLFHPDDVRDAELAHLLRRGSYPLEHITTVVQEVRRAGGTTALAGALASWQAKLTDRGVAMLHASAALATCVDVLRPGVSRG
ncbi:TioE family transcriptional regulator [Spiractinospora alimapuensis]|uniref:TioE family transcriptional regulator n=1 Tax=Spiractinospora alimapuensis TaxID=2820884 RepID=UPI001F16B545|nr:TioE family transcriptional regulator [Spiractinospora alimapuensis]QVQ51544.1 TioE family transcriptional regulator [Spiractinospora alimapuensis]